jgi:hypothetical protein
MSMSFVRIVSVSVILSLGPSLSRAGSITFGGDLASNLPGVGGPVATPASLAAGQTFEFPFKATVAGLASVSGDVIMTNSFTATGGTIVVTDFRFVSLSPAGGKRPMFSVTVSQDFASKVAAARLPVSEHLNGLFAFSKNTQSATVGVADILNGTFGKGFSLRRNGRAGLGEFPFNPPDNIFNAPNNVGKDVTAGLSLSLGLSDDTQNNAPRITLPASASLAFGVPEPSAAVLSGVGVLGLLLRYGWQGRRARHDAAGRCGGGRASTPKQM